MTIQVSEGMPIPVHVVYADVAPDGAGPIEVSVSNPSVATVEDDPAHPGDSSYAQVTPATPGAFVVNVTDGVLRAHLDDMVVMPPGVAPTLEAQEIALG